MKRFIFCIFMTVIAAFAFHILITAPLDLIHRKFVTPLFHSRSSHRPATSAAAVAAPTTDEDSATDANANDGDKKMK